MSNDNEIATGSASARDSSGLVPPLKPISFLTTFLLFAVPSAIFSFSLLVLLPALMRRGFPSFAIFNLTFLPPLAMLLIASLAGLKLEGRSLTWPVIRNRFRLGRLPRYGWLWIVGLCVFEILASVLPGYVFQVSPTSLHLYTAPKEFSDFMGALSSGGKDFLGIPLHGQWWVFFYFLFGLIVFNIFGEELWWRGYILPRQELAQGRWTWVVHGVLWDGFHIFYHQTAWSFLAYLPVTLSIAYVCQKTKNTWPGIISHTVANAAVPVAILRGILS
jgi:membrane protease YdiL (CAAX protease family)